MNTHPSHLQQLLLLLLLDALQQLHHVSLLAELEQQHHLLPPVQ